jgi:Flp pilus assembly pilin Flp
VAEPRRRTTRDDEAGATAIEYALLGVFIAAVVVFLVGQLGEATIGLFQAIAGTF